jgi:hypothetical protein
MAKYVTVPIEQDAVIFDVVCTLDWDDEGPFATLPRDRGAALPEMIRLYQNKLMRLDGPGPDEGLPPKYYHKEVVVVP